MKRDHEIDSKPTHEFLKISSDLKTLSKVKLVRNLSFSGGMSVTLNLMVYDSIHVYGKSNFILARARVAPIKG